MAVCLQLQPTRLPALRLDLGSGAVRRMVGRHLCVGLPPDPGAMQFQSIMAVPACLVLLVLQLEPTTAPTDLSRPPHLAGMLVCHLIVLHLPPSTFLRVCSVIMQATSTNLILRTPASFVLHNKKSSLDAATAVRPGAGRFSPQRQSESLNKAKIRSTASAASVSAGADASIARMAAIFLDTKRRIDDVLGETGTIYGSARTGLYSVIACSGSSDTNHAASDLDLTYFMLAVAQNNRSCRHEKRKKQVKQLEEFKRKIDAFRETTKEKDTNREGGATSAVSCWSSWRLEVVEFVNHGARVPLLRCRASIPEMLPECWLSVEVTVNNELGVRNSHLLKQYMSCPHARALALGVKAWAKSEHLVRNRTNGLLSSYAYTLMVVAFLQM
eukprot:g13649.t1